MTPEQPGYAERDTDETTEQTGGGVDPAETDADAPVPDEDEEQAEDQA